MKTLSIRHDAARIREHCIERAEFKTHGNMCGKSTKHEFLNPGRLPSEYMTSFLRSEYAIYSYNTPIAWFGPEGWTFPKVKYSVTTSAHQSKLSFIRQWIEV